MNETPCQHRWEPSHGNEPVPAYRCVRCGAWKIIE